MSVARLPAPRDLVAPRRVPIAREELQAIIYDETVALMLARGEAELGAIATGDSLARKIGERLYRERPQ